MKLVNYEKAIKLLDPLNEKVTNSENQIIEFYDSGDDLSMGVYAICHELKKAAKTDFLDTSDFKNGNDYVPVFMDDLVIYEYQLH